MKLACFPSCWILSNLLGPRFFFSMSDLTKPFDFSEIVGYPNDIPEDVLDNVLNFHMVMMLVLMSRPLGN
jgi:hypothetical protein